MDYKEKYEQALERARKYHHDIKNIGCVAHYDVFEDIFPELKESEDERIRKKLYNTVLGTPDDSEWFQDISKDAMLAYLEKQKSIYDEWAKDREGCFWDGVAEGRRQKEQKPAEWSEEDEKTINDACCWIGEYANSLQSKNYAKSSQLYSLAERLKSLRPSWKPSEEQMETLKRASTNEYLSAKQFDILVSLYEQLKRL